MTIRWIERSGGGERAKRASFEEDEHTRDESPRNGYRHNGYIHNTTELTFFHSIRLTRLQSLCSCFVKNSPRFARCSNQIVARKRREEKARYNLVKSPFDGATSKSSTAPAWTIGSINDDLKKVTGGGEKDDEVAQSEPADSSSIGVQLLSDNKSVHGHMFLKAGTRADDWGSADRAEPTSTTYRPKNEYLYERQPSWGLVSRIEGGEAPDEKFRSFVGPGSYDEMGGTGDQVLSQRKSAGRAVMSTDERAKYLGNLGQWAVG